MLEIVLLVLSYSMLAAASLGLGSLLRWRSEGFKAHAQSEGQAAAVERLLIRWDMVPFAFNFLTGLAIFSSVIVAGSLASHIAQGWWPVVFGAMVNLAGVLGVVAVTRWLCLSQGLSLAPRFAGVAYYVAGLARPVHYVLQPWHAKGTDATLGDGENGQDAIKVPVIDPESDLTDRERQMIRAILRLEETTAREVMVPRPDIVAVETEIPFREVMDLMIKGGYSRVPLFAGNIDNIVGIIYARDLLTPLANGEQDLALQSIARQPNFVPETKRVDELLKEFQERRIQIAIVVDEYGGTSGLVSLEDLMEEIVGDIEDEFRQEETSVVWLDDGEAIMDAGLSLEELDELFSVRIEGQGYDTIGGYVYDQLGTIPKVGDVVTRDGELTIEVLSTLHRRIKRLKVTRSSSSRNQVELTDEES